MKKFNFVMRSLVVGCLLSAGCLMPAGCGNVTLKGEALTAAQQSTMDAYQAVQRSGATAASGSATTTSQPTWEQSYLVENFKQWRFFVRSARKDLTWGPTLEGE